MSKIFIKSKEPLRKLIVNQSPTDELVFQPFYSETGSTTNYIDGLEIQLSMAPFQSVFEKMINSNANRFNQMYDSFLTSNYNKVSQENKDNRNEPRLFNSAPVC